MPTSPLAQPSRDAGFHRSVFLNCPFDEAYLPILRALAFTVLALGLRPRIALERLHSGETRLAKILELIRASRFAIHDLSRLKAARKGEYFRLNMPFELGLDIGCATFGDATFAEKRCLILEAERYRYQAAISDLSNSDIAVHADDPQRAMAEVRNWLRSEAGLSRVPGPTALWNRFLDFNADHAADLLAAGYSTVDVQRQPFAELLAAMEEWLARGSA